MFNSSYRYDGDVAKEICWDFPQIQHIDGKLAHKVYEFYIQTIYNLLKIAMSPLQLLTYFLTAQLCC